MQRYANPTMRVDGQATGEPSRGVHSRRVSRTGPAKAGTRNCSSTPAGAPLEELHVNDLRPEVLPFGFLSSEEGRVDTEAVFVKVVEAKGSYAAGSAGSSGGLIQAASGS